MKVEKQEKKSLFDDENLRQNQINLNETKIYDENSIESVTY